MPELATVSAHPGVGIGQRSLHPRAVVLDHERARADLPQRLSPLQLSYDFGLAIGETEGALACRDVPRRLAVDDPGCAVGQQSARGGVTSRPLIPRAGDVTGLVGDDDVQRAVLARELEVRAEPLRE